METIFTGNYCTLSWHEYNALKLRIDNARRYNVRVEFIVDHMNPNISILPETALPICLYRYSKDEWVKIVTELDKRLDTWEFDTIKDIDPVTGRPIVEPTNSMVESIETMKLTDPWDIHKTIEEINMRLDKQESINKWIIDTLEGFDKNAK